jgi:O-acetyl-ADP-ribose deacetylase (regulator of RNase III)
MIERGNGDLLQADVEVLVNAVNCVGVMGRGIALQFKKAFPANYESYRKVCDRNGLRPGMMLVHDRVRPAARATSWPAPRARGQASCRRRRG